MPIGLGFVGESIGIDEVMSVEGNRRNEVHLLL